MIWTVCAQTLCFKVGYRKLQQEHRNFRYTNICCFGCLLPHLMWTTYYPKKKHKFSYVVAVCPWTCDSIFLLLRTFLLYTELLTWTILRKPSATSHIPPSPPPAPYISTQRYVAKALQMNVLSSTDNITHMQQLVVYMRHNNQVGEVQECMKTPLYFIIFKIKYL
jgi:hypothetical protein